MPTLWSMCNGYDGYPPPPPPVSPPPPAHFLHPSLSVILVVSSFLPSVPCIKFPPLFVRVRGLAIPTDTVTDSGFGILVSRRAYLLSVEACGFGILVSRRVYLFSVEAPSSTWALHCFCSPPPHVGDTTGIVVRARFISFTVHWPLISSARTTVL